jgi:undecaprenyl-diphosphatase
LGVSVAFLQIVVFALVQGVTEFVPVSSTTHQVLIRYLTGWTVTGLSLELAAHLGTLAALLLYFWRDIGAMSGSLARASRQMAQGRPLGNDFWLVVKLLVTTVPAIGAEYLIHRFHPSMLRSVEVLAWNTIGFGILLLLVDKTFMTIRSIEHLTLVEALILGFVQMLAFLPGVSRTDITLTGGRLLGMERLEAARFSFLMAVPALVGYSALLGYQIFTSGETAPFSEALTVGALSMGFGLIALTFVMAWLRSASTALFVVYRLAIGAALIVLIHGLPFRL